MRNAGIAFSLLVATAAVAGTEVRVDASLAAGVDSNPLRVSGTSESASFTEGRLAAALQGSVGSRSVWTTRMRGQLRAHGSSASDADTGAAAADLSLATLAWKGATAAWVLRAGGRYSAYRATYVDRISGFPATVLADPNDPNSIVEVGDRLDHAIGAMYLDSRWKLSDRWRLGLEVTRERTDFRNDYDAYDAIPRLDHRALTVEPSVRFEPVDGIRLDLSWEYVDRKYDALEATDGSGAFVAGSRRRYRYGNARLGLSVRPGEAWDLDAVLDRSGRRDLGAAYYDSTSWDTVVTASRDLGRGFRGRLTLARGTLAYANAKVSTEPDAGYRESDQTRYQARCDKDLGRGISLWLETGRQRADGTDPEFAYRRSWALTGVRFRWEPGGER